MDDLDIVILAASSSEKFKDSSSLLNDKGLIHSALANKNANQDQQPNNGNLPGVDNANLRVDTSETQAENRRRRRSSNSFSTQNNSFPKLPSDITLPKTLLPISIGHTLLSNLLKTLSEAGVPDKHNIYIVVKKSDIGVIRKSIGRITGLNFKIKEVGDEIYIALENTDPLYTTNNPQNHTPNITKVFQQKGSLKKNDESPRNTSITERPRAETPNSPFFPHSPENLQQNHPKFQHSISVPGGAQNSIGQDKANPFNITELGESSRSQYESSNSGLGSISINDQNSSSNGKQNCFRTNSDEIKGSGQYSGQTGQSKGPSYSHQVSQNQPGENHHTAESGLQPGQNPLAGRISNHTISSNNSNHNSVSVLVECEALSFDADGKVSKNKYFPSDTIDALHAVLNTVNYRNHMTKYRNFRSSMMVLPCDLVCTSADLKNLAYTARSSRDETGLFCLFNKVHHSDVPLPGSSDKPKVLPETLYTLNEKDKIVKIEDKEVYADERAYSTSLSLASQGQKLTITNRIQDLHAYLFKPWVLDFCNATRKIKHFKDLPFLNLEESDENDEMDDEMLKKFKNNEKIGSDLVNSISGIQSDLLPFMVDFGKNQGQLNSESSTRDIRNQLFKHYQNTSTSFEDEYSIFKNLLPSSVREAKISNPCGSGLVKIIMSENDNATRVRDFLNYLKVVRDQLKIKGNFPKIGSDIHQKSVINTDKNKNIKQSSIAANVAVAKNAIVCDSVIMEDCVLRENSRVTNSFLHSGVIVPKDITIRDSIVFPENLKLITKRPVTRDEVILMDSELGPRIGIRTPGLKKGIRITFSRSRKFKRDISFLKDDKHQNVINVDVKNNGRDEYRENLMTRSGPAGLKNREGGNVSRPLGLLGPAAPKIKRQKSLDLEDFRNTSFGYSQSFNLSQKSIIPPITPAYSQEKAFKMFHEEQAKLEHEKANILNVHHGHTYHWKGVGDFTVTYVF